MNALLNLKRPHSGSPSSSPFPHHHQPLAPPRNPSRGSASKKMKPTYDQAPSNNSQSVSGSDDDDDDDDSGDEMQSVQASSSNSKGGAPAAVAKGKGKAGAKVKAEDGTPGGGKVKPKATRGSR